MIFIYNMPKFHLVVSNGHHRPFIWQQSFCAIKQSSYFLQKGVGGLWNKKLHMIILDQLSWIQKVPFCGIYTRNVLVRADLRLKNGHWSSNAKKFALFISKKKMGDFFMIFSTYSYSTSLVEHKKRSFLTKNVDERADIRLKNWVLCSSNIYFHIFISNQFI